MSGHFRHLTPDTFSNISAGPAECPEVGVSMPSPDDRQSVRRCSEFRFQAVWILLWLQWLSRPNR